MMVILVLFYNKYCCYLLFVVIFLEEEKGWMWDFVMGFCLRGVYSVCLLYGF